MTYTVDKATGGPYTHEIDAIRDERYRATIMGVEPDFDAAFDGWKISTGAEAVIRDINKPIEAPVGDFVENVVFHDEEETPAESGSEEEPVEGNSEETESSSPESSASVVPDELSPIFSELSGETHKEEGQG